MIMSNVSKVLIVLVVSLAAFVTEAFAADAKGLVVASRGTVIASNADGDSRELGQGRVTGSRQGRAQDPVEGQ